MLIKIIFDAILSYEDVLVSVHEVTEDGPENQMKGLIMKKLFHFFVRGVYFYACFVCVFTLPLSFSEGFNA